MQMDAPTQLRRVCELRLERWATLSGVMMASGAPVSTKICEKPDVNECESPLGAAGGEEKNRDS